MRSLLWFSIGFAIGVGISVSWLWRAPLCILFLIFSGTALLGFILERKLNCVKIPARIFLGVAIGFCWIFVLQILYYQPLSHIDGVTDFYEITATDFSQKSLYDYEVDGFTVVNGKPYRLRTYLKSDLQLNPGDQVKGEFRIRATTPGGLKESGYYQSNGIYLMGSQKGEVSVHRAEHTPVYGIPAVIGHKLKSVMEEIFPGDVYPFAKALILGDTDSLDFETDFAFKTSGIRHIVAVSGLHVAFLYALAAHLIGGHKWRLLIAVSPLLLIFAAVAGFSPSVCRASIMLFLMMLSEAIHWEYDPPTELAFAGLVILVVNPFTIQSAGFQLSVASVAGIILFSRKIYSRLVKVLKCEKGKERKKQFLRSMCASASITLGAMSLSTPISVYYFHSVSIVGVITNLLVLWVVSFAFCGVIVASLLGLLYLPVGIIAGKVVALPLRYVLFIAKSISKFPYSAVYTQNIWILIWIILCYALIAMLVLCRRRWKHYLITAALSLIAAITLGAIPARTDNLRLTVLDVGQGQSILLQSRGKTYLVDCGGTNGSTPATQVIQTLYSQSIFHIDGVILTHSDSDHTNGLENIMSVMPVESVYFSSSDVWWAADHLQYGNGYTISVVDKSMRISMPEGNITLLTSPHVKSDNENSMGILFESDDCAILITGDRGKSGEKALLKYNAIPDVDVLIAGHHGSKNSTNDLLLDTVQPEMIIVSAGRNNSFVHPAPEMLERAENHGCEVRRTDLQGTILFRR